MDTIAAKIRSLRLRKGLTTTELAKLAGLSQGYISDVENERTTPSVKSLNKIAQALGVQPTDLLDKDESRIIMLSELQGLNEEFDAFIRENPGVLRSWLELAKDCERKDIKPEHIKVLLEIMRMQKLSNNNEK